MSNSDGSRIIFQEEQSRRTNRSFISSTPKIVQLVIKYSNGLVKNESQANYVLIFFVVVTIIFSFVLTYSSGGTQARFEAPPGQRIIYPDNAPPQLR